MSASAYWWLNNPTIGGSAALPRLPLAQRAAIRGAMWTARGPLPWGPRPRQPDNCICIDYFEVFSPADRTRIIREYCEKRRYTHAPMGPLVDPGYHGQLPSVDWRSDPMPYFDAAEELTNALRVRTGVGDVIHFLRPDRGVLGLEWTVDDLDRELGPIFRSSHAQSLMTTVCLGWEPGPRYYYDNAWWVQMCQWMARTFPNALRLIHMVGDCDSPVGGDDDKRGISNGQGWANVAPYLHGFLAQYLGYVGGGDAPPQSCDEFIPNIQNAINDLHRRFRTGGPDGTWPTSSAWGSGQPLRVYAAEYAAFRDYWENAPEEESWRIGDATMVAGADGYLDGGTVDVPVK